MMKFKTVDEVMAYYYPKMYKEKMLSKMSPGEYGKMIGQEILDIIRDAMRCEELNNV